MPPPDQAGLLGFKAIIFAYPTYTVLSARTNGDYGLDARVTGISQLFTLRSFNQWLWGVPADPDERREALRKRRLVAVERKTGRVEQPRKSDALAARRPVSGPLSSTFHSYAFDFIHFEETAPWPEVLGCDLLGFDPSLSASPSTKEADTASGVDTALEVPQPESPQAPSNSQIKAVKVTFPEGFSINPGAADGKVACDAASIKFETTTEAECPQFSKVGSLTLLSSALPEALPGSIYLGEPLPGNRYRIFTSADGYGTHIKLEGVGPARPPDRPADGRLRRPSAGALHPVRHAFLRLRTRPAGDPDPVRPLPGRNQLHPLGRLPARSAVGPVLRDHLGPGWGALSRPGAPVRSPA